MRILAALIVLVGVLGGGLVASGAVQIAPPEPAATANPRATVPPAIQEQLQSIDRALAQARQANGPVQITLTFKEADLQASVASQFPQTISGVTFSDPSVELAGGQLVLEANASASIFRSHATIAATPLAAGGRPSVRVDSVSLGALPVPDQLKASISAQLASAIAAVLPAKLVIDAITVGQGTLTVSGAATP